MTINLTKYSVQLCFVYLLKDHFQPLFYYLHESMKYAPEPIPYGKSITPLSSRLRNQYIHASNKIMVLKSMSSLVFDFWFLFYQLEGKIEFKNKNVFLFLNLIMKPIGRKKYKNQKRKRVFGFSFLSDQFY